MKNKLILSLLLGIFLISLASASIENIGSFEQDGNAHLVQTVTNSTYCTLTRVHFDGDNALIYTINQNMTKSGNDYNYTFSNTTYTGKYHYVTCCDPDGIEYCVGVDFTIGVDLTTGRAIAYIGFIIILLFIFILTTAGAIKVNWKHSRDSEGKIISINDFRYLKVFLFAMVYLEMMFLFGLSYKFFNEANIQGFTEFFNFIYQLLLHCMYPIIILTIIIMFVIWINNIKLKKKQKLGL